MVRNESFSLSDICIWVRFDKYNTINRSCGGGRGEERVGEERGERKGGRERREKVEGEEDNAVGESRSHYMVGDSEGVPSVKLPTNLTMHETQLDGRNTITCAHYKSLT